jgi:DNA-binding GntR family transcriptional regulator
MLPAMTDLRTRTAPPDAGNASLLAGGATTNPAAAIERAGTPSLGEALGNKPDDLRASHTDLAGRTYQAVRELIVTRAVGPGAKVTAEGLSQRFGVSRTTVKTALDQLAAEGLVTVRPQVGTFVRGLTGHDVRAIWDAREMIESFAVRRGAALAMDAQREALHALVMAMAPLVEGDEYRKADYERSVTLNRRFHELLVETGDNPYLLGMYRQLNTQVHIVDYQSRRGLRRASLGLEEHRAIDDAYARRDPEAAASVVTRHIERSRDVVLQAIAKLGDVL